jgi:Heterokaryon incompatibility protein (HET)
MSIKYRPLMDSLTEIRLLELQPAREEFAPLKAKLIHTSLKDTQYQALSYVWGNQIVDRVDIEITYEPESLSSGSPSPEVFYTSIGQNLGTALCHLRQSDNELLLWADAICINQQNNEEKSNQVQIMYSIFQSAVLVVAWLGPAGPHTEKAIDQMKRIGHELTLLHFNDMEDLTGFIEWLRLKWESKNPVDDSGNSIGPPLHDLSLLLEQDIDFMNGTLDLYNRPYWCRVWVRCRSIATHILSYSSNTSTDCSRVPSSLRHYRSLRSSNSIATGLFKSCGASILLQDTTWK